MVDISFRPIRLNRISFLPASVSKYHELPLFTRSIGVGQFCAPMYKTIVPSGSLSKRCISWYLCTKLARFWASSISSPDETICFPSGPRTSSIASSSLFCAAVTSALLASSGDENRSEEHTSELQSLTNIVCRLLLVKKCMSLVLRYPRDMNYSLALELRWSLP